MKHTRLPKHLRPSYLPKIKIDGSKKLSKKHIYRVGIIALALFMLSFADTDKKPELEEQDFDPQV